MYSIEFFILASQHFVLNLIRKMNIFNSFIDYFMDFHKVRKFQELCGLSEKQPDFNSNEVINVGTPGMQRRKLHEDSHSCSYSNCNEYSEDSVAKSKGSHSAKVCCENRTYAQEEAVKYTVNKPILHYLFLFGSLIGTEVFYISCFPVLFWNLDVYIARRVITVWVVTMYLGQAAKDLLRWPRPTWPPVFKLETRVEAEYGLPSTHAIAATAFPFTILFASMGRYEFNFAIALCLACAWCALVSLSRLYVGMHSILDVMAGIALTFVYLYFGWPFMEMVIDYTLYSKYAPYIIIISHFLLAIFYPNSDRWSTTRGDTVIILGSGAGIHSASWCSNYYGYDWSPSGEPPYHFLIPSLHQMGIGLARYVIGLTILVTVRAVAKHLSLRVICHAVSVSKDDELSRRRREIEVPYKFITYACVGFSSNFIVPALLQYFNIVF